MNRARYENIILIGFMGVGKTTVGKLLSQRIGYRFIDTDELIVSTAGISIPDIFARYGEKYFRELEKRAIGHALRSSNVVLATGGGAVVDPANFLLLKERGCVIALDAGRILYGTGLRPQQIVLCFFRTGQGRKCGLYLKPEGLYIIKRIILYLWTIKPPKRWWMKLFPLFRIN